ncbi:MAG: DMT family transporter [Quisquiliibacterium sp.]
MPTEDFTAIAPWSRARLLVATRTWFESLSPTLRGMLWTIAAGILFSVLNGTMRLMALQLDSYQTQFMRYGFGLVVMLPFVFRTGLASFRPNDLRGQLVRGAVHTAGMFLWFSALPKIPLADTTAIGFTTPIFIMLGASLVLGEKMVAARWVAAIFAFAGVMIVVGPKLSGAGGYYNLMMLASAPVFAASFLLAKKLTRRDGAAVIVLWQSLTVTVFTMPAAIASWTAPTPLQWLLFLCGGVLGSLGHYCLNRGFKVADISATQPVKFLDLIWASAMGFLLFGNLPTQTTLIGGALIFVSTVWIARSAARRSAALAQAEKSARDA